MESKGEEPESDKTVLKQDINKSEEKTTMSTGAEEEKVEECKMESKPEELEADRTVVKQEIKSEEKAIISMNSEGNIDETAETASGSKEADLDIKEDKDAETVDQSAAGNKFNAEKDVYAYLKREEFTTEIFKVEIRNLPRKFGYSQLKKRLHSMNLKPGKIKAFPNQPFAFVNFRSEEEREEAIKVIDGHKWKGRDLKAKFANPAADPLVRKRKLESEQGESSNEKVQKTEEQNLNPSEMLNNAVTPYWKIPYEEQVKSKQEETIEYMKRLGWDIGRDNPDEKCYLAEQRTKFEGIICQLDDIKQSPIMKEYRNKCEFTIGKSTENKDKTVGFRLGSYKTGSVRIVSCKDCIHIAPVMKTICQVFEEYLQTSPLSSFDPESKQGHYRVLTVRTSSLGGVLVIADFHPQKLSKEEIEAEKERMHAYFSNGSGKDSQITSLHCSVHSDRQVADEEVPLQHILGEKFIAEELLGMKFQISPNAFFQVNTPAAEVLYSTVKEWCNPGPQTTVLDICCGTGTIGLSMAKDVEKVVGIELCLAAVENAKENARINGITNAEFHCGKAEKVLPPMMKRYSDKDVVAIVDPPRGGLHADMVLAIRRNEFIKRLIYVSCNKKGAILNLIAFTRTESRKTKGPAFRIKRACALDLFPHTNHCELVLMLER